MKFLLGFMALALICLAAAGAAAWQLGYFQPVGTPVTFTVQKGENFAQLGHKLQAQGIIHSARALRWYVNFLSPHHKLQRGEFALVTGMPIPELVTALTEGKPIEYKFTVAEGENIFQIAEGLEAKGLAPKADFLAAVRSPDVIKAIPWNSPLARPRSVEGYLYPDTYLLQKVFSPKEIALIMVARFKEVFRALEPDFKDSMLAKDFLFNSHQMVTLASIVEKETGAAEERPQIASVFVNRLKKRMRLQTDPTIIYGIYLEKGTWDGSIGRAGLDSRSDYNTYQHDGLPPGPISNPGLNALKAVAHPAVTDYLYFVSRGDGTSVFSKDLSTHTKAVQTNQLAPGAKDGKSWRNLDPSKRAK
ncbi:MAG: endolytic transglycosylase MltG [Bdellovibrionota bacterium]